MNRLQAGVGALVTALMLNTPATMAATTYSSQDHTFRLETVAEGLDHPWSLAFLPNGDKLITERAGRLRLLRDNTLVDAPITGLPDLISVGQGGLLDVVLHPDFSRNRLLVLSYAHQNSAGLTTRVAKATYRDGALSDVEVIFEARPRSGTRRHFAGRMAFDQAGNLYIAVGDRGDKPRAQNTRDDAGGVHRITLAGQPAPGNPFLDDDQVQDTFFTYGNRNIQGMTRHPETGVIWSHEHGPRGGDEINILRPGTNYGWPTITYGIDYSGVPITDKTALPGMAQPLHYWDPSIAPSGMAFYTGSDFPAWRGDLFVGALKMRKLVRLKIIDEQVIVEEDLLTDFGKRIRDVRMGPDGHLWLLTDESNGKVLRLVPAH
ncbi:PQQ-dependent sugar dehydrogenase [Marinobacter caseinilyticus]|uniref:PQQ-dependent sugar dehydrogenase n=1 Tax=Marinobacter caseinilyticus TaxID=2692195 RepID=UPI00140A2017|nr:PQQ-dependent sugar dehydrogenase [Marinobacter caseinilyticus]